MACIHYDIFFVAIFVRGKNRLYFHLDLSYECALALIDESYFDCCSVHGHSTNASARKNDGEYFTITTVCGGFCVYVSNLANDRCCCYTTKYSIPLMLSYDLFCDFEKCAFSSMCTYYTHRRTVRYLGSQHTISFPNYCCCSLFYC